ncbi:MAG: HEAT repeat domain-containing protein [Nitrospirae bacterium]|nr:HEAT repeat domain-containing protein [Nitrospirota bacterium]
MARAAGADALPFLIYVTEDDRAEVRLAAAESLASFPTPESTEALVTLLEDVGENTEIKLAAAESLARHRTDRAREAIGMASQALFQPLAVRERAVVLLQQYFAAAPPPVTAGSEECESGRRCRRGGGRPLAIAAGSLWGGWSLMTLGWLNENPTSSTIGAGTGLALGGLGTAMYFQDRFVTPAQAGAVLSDELWGLWSGLAFAAAADIDDSRAGLASGLLGQSLGLAWGVNTAKRDPDGGDVTFANLSGLMGTSLVGSYLVATEADDSRLIFGTLAAGGLLGRGVGVLVSPHLAYSQGDVALTNLLMFEAAWLGAFGPGAVQKHPEGRTISASMLGGVPAAFGVSAALSGSRDPAPEAVGVAFGLGAYGKMLGAGIPLLADNNDSRTIKAAMLGASGVGLLSAIPLAPRMQYTDDDTTLILAGTAWGFWQGIGSSVAADARDNRVAGAALVGTSTAGLISMGAARKLDVPPVKTALAVSGGFWGAWIPFWGGFADRQSAQNITTLCLIGSDMGLAAASAALGTSEGAVRTLENVNLGGLAGAALGSVAAGIATVRARPVAAATSIGSAAGLAAGAIVAGVTKPAKHNSSVPARRRSSLSGGSLWNRFMLFPVYDPNWEGTGRPLTGFSAVIR